MFNDLKVSSSVVGQVPAYFPSEYPNFVNFLKDYYRFLETNSNSLDILNGIQKLIDIDTYTGVDYTATLTQTIDSDDSEIIVSRHVEFPRSQGLLKIDDEVIFYKKRVYGTDDQDNKITTFTGCTRGFTYNDLSYDTGFTVNNETTPAVHYDGRVVYNQSYSYILYFLEELRSNYLVDFPSNVLNDNLGSVNIDQILKKAKDFYLSKGTPSGIEFYFKFLFQKKPELRNYKENLHSPSEATYQSKTIVRLESLDNYYIPDLVENSITQKGLIFPVQTATNVFSFASQVYEFEISNAEDLLPTQFTVITAIPEIVGEERRLYVDSTYGFPVEGFLRINQDVVEYTGKTSNYFECNSSLDTVTDNFSSTGNINLLLGDVVYDQSTLSTVSNDPGSSFVVYVGISDVIIENNNIGYQKGDLGFVSNILIDSNLIVSGWTFNDTLPLDLNESLVAGVTKVYTNDTDVYMAVSNIPYYSLGNNFDSASYIIKEKDFYVRLPKAFNQSNEGEKEDIPTNTPVGILRDGTPILSWRGPKTLIRGKLKSVSIVDGGSNFNVNNPPGIVLDSPAKLTEDQVDIGVTAEVSLGINGSLSEVYIKNTGAGYDKDTAIIVTKSATNDPNVPFRDAVIFPLVVNGKISKIRIIDPGTGYTEQPTFDIITKVPPSTPGFIAADIEFSVLGSIYKVNIDEPGSLYTEKDPEYRLIKGIGASGTLTIENGKITLVDLVNGGQFYNSPPQVTVIDSTGGGVGAEIIAEIDTVQGVVSDLIITNPGLNYNEFNTSIVITESGGGELLQPNIERWTVINNWDTKYKDNPEDTVKKEFFNSTDGSFLLPGPTLGGKKEKTFTILGSPKKLEIDGVIPNLTNNVSADEPHSPIIGWALDGSPIYGPYGRLIATDSGSDIVKLNSSYVKFNVNDSQLVNSIRVRSEVPGLNTSEYPMGSFEEDYYFVNDAQGLDSENGRFCVTPEFPEGIYAYFTTVNYTDKKQGFPFFVGPKFKGKTFKEFNELEISNIEGISGLKRYLSPEGNAYHNPSDTGNFVVDSIPLSTNATLNSIDVLASGSGYKVGDILEFENTGTDGFGAAGYVSTIKGQSVTSVSKDTFDYLEYDDENLPFSSNSSIQSSDGFSAVVHVVDQKRKTIYLDNVINGPLKAGTEIYDTSLTIDETVSTETVGFNLLTVTLNSLQFTADLVNSVDSVTGYFELSNYTPGSGSIANFPIGTYVQIGSELCKIIANYPSENAILVVRGKNNTNQESYPAGTTLSATVEINVFDSSAFKVGDIIKINTEKFKVIDTDISKDDEVVGTKIVDGGSGLVGTYYCFFDGVLQDLAGAATDVITLGASGDITDISFTPQQNIVSNPKVEIGTLPTYDDANQVIIPVNILATTYRHKLILKRAAFGSFPITHNTRQAVNRLRFISAVVTDYDQNRILAKLNSDNNSLVQNDFVKVSAALGKTNQYQIKYNILSNPNQFEINIGSGLSASTNVLNLYEKSTNVFTVVNPNTAPINIEFYGPSYDEATQTTVIGRKYFDVNISKSINANQNITTFVIFPDDSDLTKYIMRVSSTDTSDYKDYIVNTISEPINGEYTIVSSSNTDFEIYTTEDPLPDSSFNYNSTQISYITRSTTASGGINTATLTSGGFNYTTSPAISGVSTISGSGAILEPVSNTIGKIDSVKAVSSGYGYSPDRTQKPSVIFPRITKIKNNFIVTSLKIEDAGLKYLYEPRVRITGGGLPNDSNDHAIVQAKIKNGQVIDVKLIYSGVSYNSAPSIDVEKYYYCKLSSSGELSFKFAFFQYIFTNDIFKVRAYYQDNGVEKFVDSSVNFYAKINSTTISCKLELIENGTPDVNPMTYITLPPGATKSRLELISLSKKASVSAIVSKSEFINGEKLFLGNDITQVGFVTTSKGWQKGSSILRIENYNYLIKENEFVRGADSGAFGIVESAFGISAVTNVAPVVQTPKQFLDTKSFLSSSALRLQDSYRYQKFAYEIGTQVPYTEWKEGYQKAAHPTGYNLFARTSIDNVISTRNKFEKISKIETNVNELVSFRKKYNYLVTKNVGVDEVIVKNRLLTDVKIIDKSVVGAFNDISDQFNGVDTAFELKVIDPNLPENSDGSDNFITEYDIDQMVVILDNIIQTYGTSWIVTDADKTIRFTSSQDSGELMPSETMHYRQFNDDAVVYSMTTTSTAATDTFALVQEDSTVFPAGIFTSIDEDNYMCFVDGALQENANFSISAGGGSPTITFGEVLPINTEISVRYLSGFLKNEFTLGTVIAGTPIVLTNVPSGSTNVHSYFVFVDGVVITTSDYTIDPITNNLIFNYGFNYDTLIVIIDPNGVSLEEQSQVLINTKYSYKVNDGQLIIPAGLVLKPEDYFIEIAGIVQSPYIVYDTITSGLRKINFFEPPQRYVGPDNTVGRQFVGLLYQRSDADGSLGTTPNYQFDDISKNIIHTKEPINNFVIGDFVINSNELVNSRIVDKETANTKVIIEIGFAEQDLAVGGTVDIIVNSLVNIFVGDRVKYKKSFELTSADDDELEISAINQTTNTITLTNISSSIIVDLIMNQDSTITFLHHTLTVQDLYVDGSITNRDDAFQFGDTILSGFISSAKDPNVVTNLDENFGLAQSDTTFNLVDATNFSINDYISLNNVEVAKITNISSNTITADRAQLNTPEPLFHGNNIVVRKIVPYNLTVQSFKRGFDGEKTEFILKENGNPKLITANKDIFVIVNGILQKRGPSYNLVEVGTSYSKLVFSEAPSDGTPFNCFYVGEQISIKSISDQFNGLDTAFDLRDVNGEIFSLISKNSEVEGGADISANLILFIDGVYQIPSTATAYAETISSFKLLGSLIEFSAPPKFGSDFEGYIFVGSPDDYRSIDVDATVERNDILDQYNEVDSRDIINVLSFRQLATTNTTGQVNSNLQSGINLGGSIIDVEIANPGTNYEVGVEFAVSGDGVDGKVRVTSVSPAGNGITGVEIISSGHSYVQQYGYDGNNVPVYTTPTINTNVQGTGAVLIPSVSPKGRNFKDYGWWLADLDKTAKTRESLRIRRTLTSNITGSDPSDPIPFTAGIFPLTGKTLYTTSIPLINTDEISSDLPTNPDNDTNLITFTIPASANFGARNINARYTTFVPRNPGIVNDKDQLQGVNLGSDLPFNQIIQLPPSASTETFNTIGDTVSTVGTYAPAGSNIDSYAPGIRDQEETITYGAGFAYSAKVVKWDASTQFLYVKLDDVNNPITTSDSIRLESNLNIIGSLVSDNLIAEYQTLSIGNVFYYNF